ncbi:putative glycoside hydrolase [Vibrio halioticoli NBRC 102217]|uniref:Putative glycoside hydrolase n=1 Tax=Vibrio halioticoli NBRC 102217 TaxID=1219072 RepID=V5FGG7_9VIBR|nr:GH92 family glycosyl hydrolase [Vibrio halioticoli]GAD88961.1 putative glycoside hydrolase [Vibrio halioticoli NBRC 102217]
MKHNFSLLSLSIIVALGGLTACNDNSDNTPAKTAKTTPAAKTAAHKAPVVEQQQLLTASQPRQLDDLTQYVDPFIGTGGTGHTHPGAVAPNGMVQMTPIVHDKGGNGWKVCSGYHTDFTELLGFGHTALSGTGIGGLNEFQMLPFTSESKPADIDITAYHPHIDKSTEEASPGYYHVKIKESNIDVQLTATERVGYHKYTFPEGTSPKVALSFSDFNKFMSTFAYTIVDDQTIRITQTISSFNTMQQSTYFYVKFDHKFKTGPLYHPVSAWYGYQGSLVLDFSEDPNVHEINAEVALSYTSRQGAEQNYDVEGNRTFDEAYAYTKGLWNKELNEVKVEGGTPEDLTTFYTALYHTNIAPHIFQDVDGQYRSMRRGNFAVTKTATDPDSKVYSVYSIWDTFRALHPLKTIIEPKHAVELAKDLLRKYTEGGILPKWELHGDYTGVMVGYPAVSVIADAITKFPDQFTEQEKQTALAAALRSAVYKSQSAVAEFDPGWKVYGGVQKENLKYVDGSYNTQNEQMTSECDPLASAKDSLCGFVPALGRDNGQNESVSYGLEMANFDHAVVMIANAVGRDDVAQTFEHRSQYWHKYWNASNPDNPSENWKEKYNMTGFMRPVWSDGEWSTSDDGEFHPYLINHGSGNYTEGTAWQWTWFVPQDVEGLKTIMGGNDAFLSNLNEVFSNVCDSANDSTCDTTDDMTGMLGQVAFGNEPSHHIPFLYNWTSEPWHTQEVVDKIQHTLYGTDRGDIVGNEDEGQMSAWYVMSALGFYQVSGSDPVLTVARPLFEKVQIPMQDGVFTITADNNSTANKYIESVTINGKPLDKNFTFDFSEFKAGGELHFVMTDDVNKAMKSVQLANG